MKWFLIVLELDDGEIPETHFFQLFYERSSVGTDKKIKIKIQPFKTFTTFFTNLIRQDDEGILAGDTGNSGVEVFTTGGQDGAVGPKALVFHHHGHITQDVPLPLFVQAFQHVGTVHCRLKGEHWEGGRRSLIFFFNLFLVIYRQ